MQYNNVVRDPIILTVAENIYRWTAVGRGPKKNWKFNPLNTELNLICHLLGLLGGATIVVVSRLRVKEIKEINSP